MRKICKKQKLKELMKHKCLRILTIAEMENRLLSLIIAFKFELLHN
jgi:hypothetical protein